MSIASISHTTRTGFKAFNQIYNFIGLLIIPLSFGIIIIIGALLGLRYQRGGPILSLSVGILSIFACLGIDGFSVKFCIFFSPIYLYGTIFTITGSIIGLIRGILKQKEKKNQMIHGDLF